MKIQIWQEHLTPPLQSLKSVFFATTSKQQFTSEVEKESFFQHWLAYYMKHWPQELLFMMDENEHVMAYLSGCSDSLKAIDFISPKVPSYSLFQEHFSEYPAHLHINTHPNHQNRGLGGQLITAYCQLLAEKAVPGVHIVTSPDQHNVRFYEKHGFALVEKKVWRQSYNLQLMGKKL